MTEPRYICAEISKTWEDGEDGASREPQFLCQKFELVLAKNEERGYRLMSFSLHQLLLPPDRLVPKRHLIETIIAVFEKVQP